MSKQKSGAGRKEIVFRYSRKADSFFKKHPEIRELFRRNIIQCCDGNTDGLGIRKMSGSRKWMRMAIRKDCRVIYAIVNGQVIVVEVLLAGNRGEIYRQYQNVR